jgi:hypothetical protein
MRAGFSHRILALAGIIGVALAQSCPSGDDSACAFGRLIMEKLHVIAHENMKS